jgi:SAM-dependent methyltransferase
MKKEAFTGDYILAMDSLPVSRFRWLLAKVELRSTDDVVDYACGSGRLLDCIHDKVAHYHGVDFSAEFVDFARERVERLGIENARFECAEISDFCARNQARFDVAFTVDFAGYLDDQDFVRLYSAIRTSLKPGGRLVLYMANGRYLIEILKRYGLVPQPKAPYLSVRVQEQYVALLEKAGFEHIRVSFTPHFSRLRLLHFLSRAPIVGQFFQAKVLLTCET